MIVEPSQQRIGLHREEVMNIMYATGLECCSDHERRLFETVLPSAARLTLRTAAQNDNPEGDTELTHNYRFAASGEIKSVPYWRDIMWAEYWPNTPHGVLANHRDIEQYIPIEADTLLLSFLGTVAAKATWEEEQDAARSAIRYLARHIPYVRALLELVDQAALQEITAQLN